MRTKRISRRRQWIVLLVAVALFVGAGAYVAANRTTLAAQSTAAQTSAGTVTVAGSAVTIQPADLAQSAVSAAGNLALVSERSVAMQVDGTVATIAVAVGDMVNAGDLLLKLETADLERSLAQAELAVESAQIALADLQITASAAEVAQAEAALVEAQQNLAEVQAGPSAAEISAANSALAAAQSAYSELMAGASDAELIQLSADLKKSEITLASAQSAYDQIAWRNEAGMSTEAATLQSATIDYESAKAAYAESTVGAANSDLQAAASAVQSALVTRNNLLNSPTATELATAQTQVAQAEATQAALVEGPTGNEVRSAQITLEQALIELEAAQRALDAATVTSPIDGVVITLDAAIGVSVNQSAVVATLADPAQLQLVIGVAEADITRVSIGQQAQIAIDAFAGQTFNGVVQSIAPSNDSSSSSVSYPVTIRLTGDDLTGVMLGMNAVATLVDTNSSTAGSWLVPTNALVQTGDTTSVQIIRGAETLSVTVVTGSVQGEWTVVQAPELQASDQAVGSVTSDTSSSSGMPDMAGGPPAGVPPGQ